MEKEHIWQIRAGLDDANAVPPNPPKEDGYKPTKCPLGAWHPFALPRNAQPTPANTTYRRCLERVIDDMPY